MKRETTADNFKRIMSILGQKSAQESVEEIYEALSGYRHYEETEEDEIEEAFDREAQEFLLDAIDAMRRMAAKPRRPGQRAGLSFERLAKETHRGAQKIRELRRNNPGLEERLKAEWGKAMRAASKK
jgi:hypothetical protein